MAYRDYELDRDYGNRGSWRGRSDFERDRWYGGYGGGAYGDWDRGWNRLGYGWGGAGAYGPDYGYGASYGRGEPWYSGYGGQWYDRGYPAYGGYGGEYGGYGGAYGGGADELRGGTTGYESSQLRNRGRWQGQWRPGHESHAGRGPRNYKRSDERIEEDVNESLTRHPGLDASEIQVAVENGEVTLTGIVESRLDKRMAEDAAESCSGVVDVHNQLRVAPPGAGARGTTDREIARAPQQEGRGAGQSGASRSGSRQSSAARSR